jgi:uncharacterized membrane protein YdjX (TVP38/TMEM64 family)
MLQGVAFVSALLAVFLLVRALPSDRLFDWVQQKNDQLGIWAPLVFILLFIAATVIFLPGWPLNVAAGVLFGPLLGGAITSIASTGAAAVSFAVGRYIAYQWVRRFVRRFPRFHAVYRELREANGWKVTAAVRLSHSLPFGLQNLLLGASPIRFVPYICTTWLISLPGIFFVAYLGHLAGHIQRTPDALNAGYWPWVIRGVVILIAAVAVAYLGQFVHRAIQKTSSLRRHALSRHAPTYGDLPWGTLAAVAASLILLTVSLGIYVLRFARG